MKFMQLFDAFANAKTRVHSTSRKLTHDEYIEILNTSCSNRKTAQSFFFRGHPKDIGMFALIDPSESKRRSIESANVHIELMSNLPSWDGWPKYSQSIIGSITNNENTYTIAQGYANYHGAVYEIIPFNDADIVICPKSSIWESLGGFGTDCPIRATEELLNFFNIDSHSWSQEGGQTIQTRIESIKESDVPKFTDWNILHSTDSEDAVKALLEDVCTFCNKEDINGVDIFKYLNDQLFEPSINEFDLLKYTENFKHSSGNISNGYEHKQMFISSKALVRRIDKKYRV